MPVSASTAAQAVATMSVLIATSSQWSMELLWKYRGERDRASRQVLGHECPDEPVRKGSVGVGIEFVYLERAPQLAHVAGRHRAGCERVIGQGRLYPTGVARRQRDP